jgi:hypothetical protein
VAPLWRRSDTIACIPWFSQVLSGSRPQGAAIGLIFENRKLRSRGAAELCLFFSKNVALVAVCCD